MKKKRILLLLAFTVMTVYQMLQGLGCDQLSGSSHFSNASFLFHIEESIHNDSNLPITVVRSIHNKPFMFIPDSLHAYLRFWDIHFLISFLTLIGFVGVMLGFWYTCGKKRSKKSFVATGIVLLLPIIEVFFSDHVPYAIRLFLLWIPLQLFSLYGFWMFLSTKQSKRSVFFVVTLFLSALWTFVFTSQLFTYCVK